MSSNSFVSGAIDTVGDGLNLVGDGLTAVNDGFLKGVFGLDLAPTVKSVVGGAQDLGNRAMDGIHAGVDPLARIPVEVASLREDVEVLKNNLHSMEGTLRMVMKVVEEQMAENKKLRAEVDELKGGK